MTSLNLGRHMRGAATIGLAAVLTLSAGGLALAQPQDPAYQQQAQQQQYQDQQQDYNRQRDRYQAQRDAYARQRDGYRDRKEAYDAQRADYEAARAAYDARYGAGAFDAYARDRVFAPPPNDPRDGDH